MATAGKWNMKETQRVWLAGMLLLLTTLVIYLPTRQFDFVLWDDDRMFYANPHLQGLSFSQLA